MICEHVKDVSEGGRHPATTLVEELAESLGAG